MWRKKVDRSLFLHDGTTIPNWVCTNWHIQEDFGACRSSNDPASRVRIFFNSKEYQGTVTVAPLGRTTPAFRLWYKPELRYKLEETFVMSFVRDIEGRLREHKANSRRGVDVEREIPFWEFLDIEYDRQHKTFFFKAYYTVKPAFSELFKHFIESPIQHKIEDQLGEKPEFRIYKTAWKPREEFENEPNPVNVVYMLLDTRRKLLYVGEAGNLVDRLRQAHGSIPNWDYFRYDVLPPETAPHRKVFERMIIADFCSFLRTLPNGENMTYRLVNSRVDRFPGV